MLNAALNINKCESCFWATVMNNTLLKRLKWNKCLLVSTMCLLRWILSTHWVIKMTRVCGKSCRNRVEIDSSEGKTGSEQWLRSFSQFLARFKIINLSYHVNVVHPSWCLVYSYSSLIMNTKFVCLKVYNSSIAALKSHLLNVMASNHYIWVGF